MTQAEDLSYVRGQLVDVKEAVADLKKDIAVCHAQGVTITALQQATTELVAWKRDIETKFFRVVVIIALAALSGGGIAGAAKNALTYLMSSQPAAAQAGSQETPTKLDKTSPLPP
jgi:hypothetical protein